MPGERRTRTLFAATFAGLALQGCASGGRCGLAACGAGASDLLKVSAQQLSQPPGELEIYDVRTYPEATVAWRVHDAAREYQCREKREAAAPHRVHFVYCRPAT